jgi:hypothetical protein
VAGAAQPSPLLARWHGMSLARSINAAAALAALAAPAAATAAAPWSAPSSIPGSAGQQTRSLFTAAGRGVVLTAADRSSPGARSLVATVTAAAAIASVQPLAYVGEALATYGADRIAVAGTSVATSGPYAGTIDDSSSVVVRLGRPGALGAGRAVAGTKRQHLYALACNRAGLMALATGRGRTRTVFMRRPGANTFTTKLRIPVSNTARDISVAVGARGDLLVVYEDAHVVRVRHIGARGAIGPVHRLGPGIQSRLQPLVGADGRLAVAWESQRVNEGDASTPATVWFATAAPGHGFGKARLIATVGQTGAGRYVAASGVRLLPAAGDDALLAYTGFDGGRYTVEAAPVRAGRVGAPQRLSQAGTDAVLGDAAGAPSGAAGVAWGDPAGLPGGQPAHTPVLAAVRAAGGAAFGAAELVSPADADVPLAPSAAINPTGGAALVAYGLLAPAAVQVSMRPAP